MNPCPETMYARPVIFEFLIVLKMANLTALNKKDLEIQRNCFGHYQLQVHTHRMFLDFNVTVRFSNGFNPINREIAQSLSGQTQTTNISTDRQITVR